MTLPHKTFSRLIVPAIGIGLTGAGTLAAVSTEAAAPAKPANWSTRVTVTANGSHMLGNPNAPVKVTEYISYTCSHCAALHKEGDPVLRDKILPGGKVSVTVSHLMRDPIDMTIAMLTPCGQPSAFFAHHNAFMSSQDVWLQKAINMPRETQARWYQGTPTERMQAISSDLGFYQIMARFGMSKAKVDQCLANQSQLANLQAQLAETRALGVTGTPSFAIGKNLLPGHNWESLSEGITQALAQLTKGSI